MPAPFGPTKPTWSPSKSPNDSSSKRDRVPWDFPTASQLKSGERVTRGYFFVFFGFFFSFCMFLPLAMCSPPFAAPREFPAIIGALSPHVYFGASSTPTLEEETDGRTG